THSRWTRKNTTQNSTSARMLTSPSCVERLLPSTQVGHGESSVPQTSASSKTHCPDSQRPPSGQPVSASTARYKKSALSPRLMSSLTQYFRRPFAFVFGAESPVIWTPPSVLAELVAEPVLEAGQIAVQLHRPELVLEARLRCGATRARCGRRARAPARSHTSLQFVPLVTDAVELAQQTGLLPAIVAQETLGFGGQIGLPGLPGEVQPPFPLTHVAGRVGEPLLHIALHQDQRGHLFFGLGP